MIQSWLWLPLSVFSLTADAVPPRQRLVWPSPVPAASVPPVDWDSVGPSVYSFSNNGRQAASNKIEVSTASKPSIFKYPVPSAVDWRNRSGINYITTAQDQGICQSCWAFAITALIETMVRIEHGIWSKRSEADVHDGTSAACDSTGNAEDTLKFVAGIGPNLTTPEQGIPGIADWPCDPYQPTFHPYDHCADRSGRATHIPAYQAIGGIEDQKRWLNEYGPVVATFALYEDFYDWRNVKDDKVYSYNNIARETGNHIALVVGFDDVKQAWIVKNSWGPEWANQGYVYIGYDTANIDYWTKYGLANVNPDPWSRKRHQSGNMMQSGNGKTHRNFELLLLRSQNPGSSNSITHISRDGDTFEWSIVSNFSTPSTLIGHPSIVGTSFNRDFHAAALDANSSVQHFVYSQSSKAWSHRSTIPSESIGGIPGLTQADDSALVMVVRHSDGSLNEWRQEPRSSSEWKLTVPPIAAPGTVAQSGPALVQSNVGLDLYHSDGTSSGVLYAAAVRTDGKMQLFLKDLRQGGGGGGGGGGGSWKSGEVFGSGVAGDAVPVMIQDFYETQNELSEGRLRLVVAVDGKVQHWVRQAEGRWEMVENVGTG